MRSSAQGQVFGMLEGNAGCARTSPRRARYAASSKSRDSVMTSLQRPAGMRQGPGKRCSLPRIALGCSVHEWPCYARFSHTDFLSTAKLGLFLRIAFRNISNLVAINNPSFLKVCPTPTSLRSLGGNFAKVDGHTKTPPPHIP